ncbi:MAG TPA: putative sulfate exporter family transporter [Eubacteriaceae bacterium]|nr:putative sulfate exporter family transporter [Eubacteriaceae bacterium]
MKNKLFSLIILGISTWLALFIGGAVPLLGTSISAILIGAIIRHTPIYEILDSTITRFVSSYLLKAGIVLLGFTLSLRILNEVGISVLIILVAGILVSILASFIVNKGLKTNKILSMLIGIGTSICGGSAIVATAPVLEAEDEDIAVSITTMFIYSMLALLILPIIGRMLGFTDQMYGIFSGAAVNDTASVVATAFDWSDEAGSIATVVKLVRTLFIVPVTLGVLYYKYSKQRKESLNDGSEKMSISWNQIKSIVPMFVVFFVMAVIFASIVPLSDALIKTISQSSKILMTIALITIGFGVHIQQIKKAGIKPVILGASSWTAVLTISVVLVKILYG